jgi:hypothetical protein
MMATRGRAFAAVGSGRAVGTGRAADPTGRHAAAGRGDGAGGRAGGVHRDRVRADQRLCMATSAWLVRRRRAHRTPVVRPLDPRRTVARASRSAEVDHWQAAAFPARRGSGAQASRRSAGARAWTDQITPSRAGTRRAGRRHRARLAVRAVGGSRPRGPRDGRPAGGGRRARRRHRPRGASRRPRPASQR